MTRQQLSEKITFIPGSPADSYEMYLLFEETLADLVTRLGFSGATSWGNAEKVAAMWQKRRPLYEHLAETAEQFWVARQGDQLVGFSRSIMRGDVRELTELFVKPGTQSGGLGRELIQRAFPANGAERRFIIATPDFRAQALYLKSGVFPRFPIYYFSRPPEQVTYESNLSFEPLANDTEMLSVLGDIDREVLGFRRDADQRWFLANRQGFLYRRHGRPVGYGYVGPVSGPFAVLDAGDFPAVLAHAESTAQAAGQAHFGLEVPMVNETAVSYLLSRGYKIDSFMAMFMSDKPMGSFDRYLVTSPPFFL